MENSEEFKKLIKEINYQESFTYDERVDIFNKYGISVSKNFINPIMLLSTFLREQGNKFQYSNARYHGTSHSGAIASSFNKTLIEGTNEYVEIKDFPKFIWVHIFNHDRVSKTMKVVIGYKIFKNFEEGNNSIKIHFNENTYIWPKKGFCYYNVANEFLKDFKFQEFF